MRKLIWLFLLSNALTAAGQLKPEWHLTLSGSVNRMQTSRDALSASSLNHIPIIDSWGNLYGVYSPVAVISDSGWQVVFTRKPDYWRYSSQTTMGISAGAEARFPLNKNFSAALGLSFSYQKFARQLVFSGPSNIYLRGFDTTGSYLGTGFGVLIIADSAHVGQAGNYSFGTDGATPEIFHFITLSIPVSIGYHYHKWSLTASLTPVIILNAEQKNYVSKYAQEIVTPEAPFSNNKHSYLSASLTPAYQLTRKIGVGMEYSQVISSSMIHDANNNVPNFTARSFSLKLSYKL